MSTLGEPGVRIYIYIYIYTKLIPLSSHVCSIISTEFWWYCFSIILFWSVISSLILTIDSMSITFCKVMIVLNESPFWTLLWRKSDIPITLSLFYVLKLFGLFLFTCEIMAVYLILLDPENNYCHIYLLKTYTPYLFIFLLKNTSSI